MKSKVVSTILFEIFYHPFRPMIITLTVNFRDNENSNSTVPAINNVNNSNTNDNNSEDNNSNNSDKNTLYNKDSITDINDHLSLLHINSRSIKF